MNRSRRNAIGQIDRGTPGEAPTPRSFAWLALILFNVLVHTIQQVATGWDGNVTWFDALIVVALVGLIITGVLAVRLIVTGVLAVRAVRPRRNWIDPEPGPPWMSPMYDPWLDG